MRPEGLDTAAIRRVLGLLVVAGSLLADIPAWCGETAKAPTTAAEVVALVDAAEAAMNDVRLEFVQVTTLKGAGESQELRGNLALLKDPSRFDVKFTDPVEQQAHYDGVYLVVHFLGTSQAFREKASPEDLSSFLGVNPAAPVKSFRTGYTATLTGCDAEECRMLFSPEGPGDGSSAREVVWTVKVDAKTWRLREASFDTGDVVVTLRCSKYVVNSGLTKDDFKFDLPEGTVMHEGLPGFMGRMRTP